MAANNDGPDQQKEYWQKELERARKRFRTFWDNGDQVVDAYRLQKADGNSDGLYKDKYNILYSSTETMRPNLYAQEPKARVKLVSVDTASPTARIAARLLEGCLGYVQREEDFDDLMNCVVEDYLLPGMGLAWARYEGRFGDATDKDGNKIPKAGGKKDEYEQKLLDEMVKLEYVHWQDVLFGVARTWKDVPWVAKRLWLTKTQATKRFGKDVASKLKYSTREANGRDQENPTETAEAWEIWDKTSRTVYWYAESVPNLLDSKPDPLKLKAFFPCPRPIRAVSNTRTLVPRALYSQYKSQAETLNVMTKRIRLLSEALRVVGVFDGSIPKLADLLNASAGNRMIPVDSWAAFAQAGGIQGSVIYLPLTEIASCLNELLKAREVCKQEIYEITGFSDIVRGVSKASETLGAQNIKADWAGARVKKLQGEVQRFARDLLALAGELIAEHCSPDTIAIFSGMPIPDPQDVQQNPQLQQQIQTFKAACDLIRNDIRRVSTIDIETDSTLLADQSAERDDRTKFLAAAGAFLQQAVPAMEATPELGPLLGAMLMFVVRTFPSSRPIEEEFEKVQQVLASGGQNSQNQDKDGSKAKAAIEQQRLQMEQENNQATLQQDGQKAQMEHEAAVQAENNRHAERMQELQIKQQELALKQQEMDFKDRQIKVEEENAKTTKFTAVHSAGMAEQAQMDEAEAAARQETREYAEMDNEAATEEADRQHEASENAADREHEASVAEDDRAAAKEQAVAVAKATPKPAGGGSAAKGRGKAPKAS